MWSRKIVLLLCLLLALAGAVDPKGSPKLPKEAGSPKGPKEDKHPKDKHHKENKDKHHKEHKDKHPKDKEAAAEEPAAAPATRSARGMATNTTDAAVEEEAQKEACAPCCGVDLGEVTSKLPFINRK
jgi:hypothetical protein